jgi:uncharacterized protein
MPAEPATRIVLRPLATPLPLGFLALAGGTLVVSGLQLGWLEPADGRDAALVLIAFVFPLQLLASVFGFLSRDVAAGTGMGILAGTWLAIGLIKLGAPPGTTSHALGLFLLLAGVAMFVSATAAVPAKVVPAAVMGLAGVRFLLTGIFELSASDGWGDLAGVVGLVLCALGLYAALALAVEDSRGATVLPVARHDGADIRRDAGVREQL